MSVDFVKADVKGIREKLALLPAREAVLLALVIRVNNKGICWPSLDTIARDISGPNGLNLNRKRLVSPSIAQLEAMGLVVKIKRGGGKHKPNFYYLPDFRFGSNSDVLYTEKTNSDKTNSESFCPNSDIPLVQELEPKELEPLTTTTTGDASFIKLLQTLQSLPNWMSDEGDTKWLEEFLGDCPLQVGDIKACRDWWDGKRPAKDKGDWKNRLRNWMKVEEKNDGGRRSATARRDPVRSDRREFTDYSNRPLG